MQKIVPQYIGYTDLIAYWDQDGIFGSEEDLITPYNYWRSTYAIQVIVKPMTDLFAIGNKTTYHNFLGDDAIGSYLGGHPPCPDGID